ncbi:MAG: hypothetical protein JO266_17940 [Acidobacteria bacterium]|nr:hypothetical protein [Acidobacteriota bacterium]MBV9480008.1 hypothetical protein [Acidobacteriota bacterium]
MSTENTIRRRQCSKNYAVSAIKRFNIKSIYCSDLMREPWGCDAMVAAGAISTSANPVAMIARFSV